MSLATSIKDFSDTLNNLHTFQTSSSPILPFLQEFFIWSAKSILSGILYIFTFEWFRDFSYLPLFNPTSCISSSYASDLFFISNIPKKTSDYLFSGFVNSFFFSLPFSLPHLITVRRLFSQGVQAAAASLLGSIVAHSLFFISIFYGLRFFIIPWFSLEFLTYAFGFAVNVLIVKELIQASPQRFQKTIYAGGTKQSFVTNVNTEFDRNQTQNFKNTYKEGQSYLTLFSPVLLRISFLSFLLTWCEELNVFSVITNLTLNAQNTYLDLYPSTNVSNSFVVHTIYVLGFLFGNCIFSFFFYSFFLQIGPAIASWTNLSSTKINDAINKLVMLFILTLTFASFPYYGLDYLFGKITGFLPEDPVYKETVFSPTKITVNKKNSLFIKAESADKKKHSSLLDINNFDNGVYLNNIDFNKWDNFPSDSENVVNRTTSFEKSNYRQENAWIRRHYLARLRSRPRKNSDNASTTSFYKAFKDPKSYYQNIQLEADKRQSKNVRKTQTKKPDGSFVKRNEGVLAEEVLSKKQNLWDQLFTFPSDHFSQVLKKQMAFGDHTFNANETFTTRPLSGENSKKENELDMESKMFAEKYTKGVKQKSSVPLLKKTKSLSTKNIIKRKFFLNPVYRTLLQTDIDAFLARQPAPYNLAENQEYDLYKKRLVLEKYYNWLRYYSPLQKDLQNVYNTAETRSFVDSVFHHQFKGTLKIAKRLFPITFDSQQNNKKNRILSYDQALYKNLQRSENPLLHEELFSRSAASQKERKQNEVFLQNDNKPHDNKPQRSRALSSANKKLGSLKPDQAQFEGLDSKLQLKELCSEKALSCLTSDLINFPFLEESDTSPFYAGWDDTSRRFVITNKFFVEKQ